jgi:hypothetical protein
MPKGSRDEASFRCGEFGHCALVSAMSLQIRTVLVGRKSKADMTCDLDLTVAPGIALKGQFRQFWTAQLA